MNSKVIYTSNYRKVWVLGDIHGVDKALEQVLKISGFDNENDLLIFVGDVVDGFPDTRQAIDRLMGIKNLVSALGNHDKWAIDFYTGQMDPKTNIEYGLWTSQGGWSTFDSYPDKVMPKEHIEFLQKSVYFCEIAEKEGYEPTKIVTHGGFNYKEPVHGQRDKNFYWDRNLVTTAFNKRKEKKVMSPYYTEIYVGHTPTINFGDFYTKPCCWSGVWNVDTGAAYTGKLSMINIESKEVFQSEVARKLYPDHPGRNQSSYNDDRK